MLRSILDHSRRNEDRTTWPEMLLVKIPAADRETAAIECRYGRQSKTADRAVCHVANRRRNQIRLLGYMSAAETGSR